MSYPVCAVITIIAAGCAAAGVAVSNRRNDWLHDGGAGGCELVRGGSAVLFCVPPRKHAFNAGDGGGQPDTPVWG